MPLRAIKQERFATMSMLVVANLSCFIAWNGVKVPEPKSILSGAEPAVFPKGRNSRRRNCRCLQRKEP